MHVRSFASTHLGRRENNEDAYAAAASLGLFVIADGMGGYAGGEVASALVRDSMVDFFQRIGPDDPLSFAPGRRLRFSEAEKLMAMAIRMANREVIYRREGELARMGSTVAAILIRPPHAVVAHVGDSRVYRWRAGHLEVLTTDHCMEVERLQAVAQGRSTQGMWHYPPNMLTRAVGVPGMCEPDLRLLEVQPGDRYLLCTDGLTDMLDERGINAMLNTLAPHAAVEQMVLSAYRRGGEDNITALLVNVDTQPA
ncbi:MAG: PP2C family protein-serine/threonine phosphatase [Polyangiales bacterium]